MILHEAASKITQEHAKNLQNNLLRLQERAQQLMHQLTQETMTVITHSQSNDNDIKDSNDVSNNDHKKENWEKSKERCRDRLLYEISCTFIISDW